MILNPDASRRHYTPEDYLAIEDGASYKSEYYNGEIFPKHSAPFAMVGASRAHNQIVSNLLLSIGPQVRKKGCDAFVNDMKVALSDRSAFFYPDLVVPCGQSGMDDKRGIITDPVLIVEVLSESTAAFDRGGKFEAYGQIPSLVHYMLVAQDRPHIDYFARQSSGDWLLHIETDLESHIDIPSVGCRLALSDVYDRLTFN